MTDSHGWTKENAPLEKEVLTNASPEELHEKRLARYSAAKTKQEAVLSHILIRNKEGIKKNLRKEANALRDCGSFLIFRHYYSIDIYKMVAGCTCKKHLLCALCAIRRAAKYISIYSKKIESVLAESDTEFDKVMITFTIKNGENLSERFDHLLSSMGKLLQKRRASLLKNPRTDTVMKLVSSAVYSYEITYKEDTGFHPHCHMIALIPKGLIKFSKTEIKGKSCFVPWDFKESLIADWKAITGDSFILDVRRIESEVLPESLDPDLPLSQSENISDLLRALVEVFKYALKMNDMDVEIQVDTYEALKGRRLIGSFGALYGVKIPKNLNDEPLDDAELPFIDLLYQYQGETYGYQVIERAQYDLESIPSRQLDFQNRLKKNQKVSSPGHYSKRIDRHNSFQADFNSWEKSNPKIQTVIEPSSF